MTYYLTQVGRAASRLLNALCGGEGDSTFSAWSWQLRHEGKWIGRARVVVVDWLNRDPSHCYKAWLWHQAHGLLGRDDAQ